MRIAVVGATGLVGRVMLKILEESAYLDVSKIIPVASSLSVGKEIIFRGKSIPVVGVEEAISSKPNFAIFSAGSKVSRDWAPGFVKAGSVVIDNSSAWRKEAGIPLIVPEINAHILKKHHKIIANPNCSTIALVMVLASLHKEYKIKRVIVSTYQSVTGTGVKAVKQLEGERKGLETEKAYPYQIDLNVIPQGGEFVENDYTIEEMKLINETLKILNDHKIGITCTVVRVPVFGGHSESVNIQFERDFKVEDIKVLLGNTKGVTLQDDVDRQVYPMPLTAEGKDEVFVGRIRRDFSLDNALNLWLVSDNLRKGAATNAIQIAAYLVEKGLV